MLILGIDPGLERIGYGVIKRIGSKLECIDYGLIKTPRVLMPERLQLVHSGVVELIEKSVPLVPVAKYCVLLVNPFNEVNPLLKVVII